MKLLLVSAVALIDPEGRVLLAQRPEGKSLAGLWEFPGGKVDPGETPRRAAARELFEETSLRVNDADLDARGVVTFAFPDGGGVAGFASATTASLEGACAGGEAGAAAPKWPPDARSEIRIYSASLIFPCILPSPR